MRLLLSLAAFATVASIAPGAQSDPTSSVEKPAALVADGIPPVPAALAESTRPYMEYRTASFQSWNPTDRSILITTRFGNVAQAHRVKVPDGARTQLSFEVDRILLASWAPTRADVLLVMKDVGGNEFYQLYALHVLRRRYSLWHAIQGRELRGRHLEFRHLPREHTKLSA